jgi:hypothetical protein
LIAALIPACLPGPDHWSEGTWRLDVEGWEGELVIKEGVETYVFELNVSGPEGWIRWTGTVFVCGIPDGIELVVQHDSGGPLAEFHHRIFERRGDFLTGKVRGIPLRFRRE